MVETTGLITAIQSHIATVIIIYIQLLFIFILAYKFFLNRSEKNTVKKKITKAFKAVLKAITIIFILIIISILLFLSNPFERAEIKTIKEIVVDDTYHELIKTKPEINKLNKEVIEQKHKENEKEASDDNMEAFNKSKQLFK